MDYNFWPTVGASTRGLEGNALVAAIRDTYENQGYTAARNQVQSKYDLSPSQAEAWMAENGMPKRQGGGGRTKPLSQKKTARKSAILNEALGRGSCPAGFVQQGRGTTYDEETGQWMKGPRCVFVNPDAAADVTQRNVSFMRNGKQISYDIPYAMGTREGGAMVIPSEPIGSKTTAGFTQAWRSMPGTFYGKTTAGNNGNRLPWSTILISGAAGAALVFFGPKILKAIGLTK